ncbi:PTS sugar transporter subunit IIA [Sandaracinobacter sp. RS1-74]|uniref:PTS sugar transporter subunit IIA n=1 Tax=Sandaracinobacteroides sayramensis TaxID=2913411 RepID=UPI001EDB9866|nr:PTS sugar transporter subunit IIA [Sandaracinobacteroides sayramensis]MCG2841878.1 PTS sugar transporter subunit IIA [Sandaracinobacteroides sayramensis]
MMKLRDLLGDGAVAFDPSIGSQKAAFERIGDLLAAETDAPAPAIAAALAERERLGTTGFGGGIAIPHGRVAGAGEMRAAVVRLAQPLEWQAVDGVPVDLLVALVGPEEAGAGHLKALALVSRTLRDRAFVAKLRGAADAGALWAILSSVEKRAA